MTKTCTKCCEDRPSAAFNSNRSRPSGLADWCKGCTNANTRARREGRKAQTNAANRERRHGALDWCFEYKGGAVCADCGDMRRAVLEFHHVAERGPKAFNIGDLVGGRKTVLSAELDKCDVICANCHLMRHAAQRED